MHPSVKAQQKLAWLRVACRIKEGAIPILRLPGLILLSQKVAAFADEESSIWQTSVLSG
jgi:hypothetical protein